jgi:HAE1 family hydrophobic/amphiphilic exporter-1
MNAFAEWLEKRYFSLTILAALLMAASFFSWMKIPLEVTPSDQVPSFLYLRAGTVDEQGPVQTEAVATTLVEGAVRVVPGLKSYSSRTSARSVSVSLQLRPGTQLDLASLQLQEALQPLVDAKILDPKQITISRLNPDSVPVVRLGITDRLGIIDLPSLVQKELRPRIEAIPQVSRADVIGSEPEILTLDIPLGGVLGRGVEPEKLIPQLRTVQERASVGRLPVAEGERTTGVRSLLEVGDLETLRAQRIAGATGNRSTRIADLGEMRPLQQVDLATNRVQGREAVFMEIFLRERADPFALERELQRVAAEVSALPAARDGVRIDWVMNRVDDLEAALDDVQSSLLQSVLITFGVILVFLRDWRRTSLISATIPLTLLLTIGVLQLAGYTLNIMTLSGLILGIGMVVDNVILVVDRTVEIRREGAPLSRAISQSVAQSMPALIMATLTNAIIFLPVVFSTSDDGFVTLLKAFQAPILATLLASLVLTAFVLPVLVRAFPDSLSAAEKTAGDLGPTRSFFSRIYSARDWMAMLCLLGALYLGERVGSIPQTDLEPPADPWVQLNQRFFDELPESERRPSFEKLEKGLLEARERIGYRALASSYSPGASTASFQLFPVRAKDPDAEMRRLEGALRAFMNSRRTVVGPEPGVKFGIAYDGGLYDSALEPRRSLEFQGPRTSVLDAHLAEMIRQISGIDGVARVLDEDAAYGQKELLFVPNETLLARLGLSPGELATKLRSAMHEGMVGPLRWNGHEVGIRIRIMPGGGEGAAWDRERVLSIPIQARSGERIGLRALGSLVEQSRRSGIARDRGTSRSRIAIEFIEPLASNRSVAAWAKIRRIASSHEFPPGYGQKPQASTENVEAMQRNMIFMILLSSVLIYLVLGASFESFILPLVVLATIPLAVLSGIFGLWALGRELDVMARLSLVILVGIGVNNAIILVDLIQELRRDGFSIRDAIIEGCSRRLQAVLMTTSIQVVGVLPVAFGNSKLMGIPYSSLGISIISGMLLSTLMTLAVLPLLYEKAASVGSKKRIRETVVTASPASEAARQPRPAAG